MREFLLKVGEIFIDALVLFGILLILILALVIFQLSSEPLDGLFFAILVVVGGLSCLFFISFCIYLLIDIHQLLEEINKKIKD